MMMSTNERMAFAASVMDDIELQDMEKMWQKIYVKLRDTEHDEKVDVNSIKAAFTNRHSWLWRNDCLFCERCTCGKCPMYTCKTGSTWDKVSEATYPKKVRVDAAERTLSTVRAVREWKKRINEMPVWQGGIVENYD